MKSSKPRILVVSAVLPFPSIAGQRQRVRLKLQALRDDFEIGFATLAPLSDVSAVSEELEEFVDRVFVLPYRYADSAVRRLAYRIAFPGWLLARRLRFSNLVVGAELGPDRVLSALGEWRPDAALFEYWHAWSTASAIGKRGSATLLDMHDLLFQTFDRDLRRRRVPTAARSWLVRGYRRQEERAWHAFDHILAINSSERDHAAAVLGPPDRTSLVPMGVDLDLWAYAWQPPETPRFAYYGGLSSAHNQDEARRCLERVMPRIWRSLPDAELWIIGSNPPRDLLDRAASDSRVHVTGFVEEPGAVLASCSVVLCPWVGRYGFRSRIVEAMAVGVPVVATPDAVDGMALDESHGLAFGENDDELAAASVTLLDRAAALHSSQLSRRRVDELYSFAATYGKLPGIVLSTIAQKGASR